MRKVILSAMLGNGLEWYDYALYAYMTLTISKLFFPAGHEDVHLLATLGIFAVGFVARPFGAILFGFIGDRYGRRAALALSIFMMAIPTGCIGLLPTYEQIGLWAPGLLTVIRILQGLSLGGAFSGSITFLVEHSPPEKRGLIGSTSIASLAVGFLLGSIISLLVRLPLSDAQYESWGWRVPFLLGIAIGFIGFYIRHACEESPSYTAAREQGTLSATPLRDTFRHEWRHVLQAIGIYIAVTMPFYLVSAYFLTFSEHTLGLGKNDVLLCNVSNMILLMIAALFSGWLADKIGRKRVIACGAALYLVSSYPLFWLLLQKDFASIWLAQAVFALLVGFYTGPVPTILVEIFPTRVRYTAMSVAYNISAAVFGGTAPMVCQWLLNVTGTAYSIAMYVMLCAVIALITCLFYRDRWREPLS